MLNSSISLGFITSAVSDSEPTMIFKLSSAVSKAFELSQSLFHKVAFCPLTILLLMLNLL